MSCMSNNEVTNDVDTIPLMHYILRQGYSVQLYPCIDPCPNPKKRQGDRCIAEMTNHGLVS